MLALPPLTRNIKLTLIGLSVLFFAQVLSAELNYLVSRYMLISADQVLVRGRFWTLLTSNLFHADMGHLFANGLALYFFAGFIDERWSTKRFWSFCLVCALGSSLTVLLWQWAAGHSVPTLGYSGVVTGLIGAFCIYNWDRQFYLLFFPMTGAILLFLIPVIDVVLILMGSNVSFAGHIGGLATGVALTMALPDTSIGSAKPKTRASDFQKDLVKQAEQALDEGDHREAYRLCHQIRSTGDIPQKMLDRVWEILAVTAVEMERFDEAESYLKRAPDTAAVRRARDSWDSHAQ